MAADMSMMAVVVTTMLMQASAFMPLQRPCGLAVAGRAFGAPGGTRLPWTCTRRQECGAALRPSRALSGDRRQVRGHFAGCLRMAAPGASQDDHARAHETNPVEAGERGGAQEGLPAESGLLEIDGNHASTAEDSDQLFFSGTAFEFALGGVALWLGKQLDSSALGVGFDLSPASIALGLVWTIVPCAFVYSIKLLDLEELKEIEAITRDFSRRLFVGRSDLGLALFCFGAGFGEELLFRGVFHQELETLFGFFPAAAIVGLGFGASHNLTPAYFTISGLTSFIFSYMFASSGSNVVVPVVAHATYDYIALKLTLREIEELDAGK